ncbi:MAG: SOS response-associated peptidase family protein [Elusimicrobia bacterium]|nr:SOS response-associated peptidase family protein [Elusimicrobiota bacterium]
MCGRFTLTVGIEALRKRFGFDQPEFDLRPRYNLAPTQDAPVVLADGAKRTLALYRWGLIPSWAKDAKIGNQTINARSETAAEKASFRTPFAKRRCLVLADGFYEWKEVAPHVKWPMRIVLKSREPFAFAGLWDEWRSPEGKAVRSFTILTTEAPESTRELHDRVPVILNRGYEPVWLDPKSDRRTLENVLIPPPDDALEFFPVSPMVNSPKSDVPECITPAEIVPPKPAEPKPRRKAKPDSPDQPSLF